MAAQLSHIFKNNLQGRETLLQSLYFCKAVDISLAIYIPKHNKFLMYFENDIVQVDLDKSYLTSPETAVKHAIEIVKKNEDKSEISSTRELLHIKATGHQTKL